MSKILCENCKKEIDISSKKCPYCVMVITKSKRKYKLIPEFLKSASPKNKILFWILSIVVIIILLFLIENLSFKIEIKKAKEFYNNQEFAKVEKIVDRYALLHKNDEFIIKYKFIEPLVLGYKWSGVDSNDYSYDDLTMEFLLWGYKNCTEVKINNETDRNWVNEVKKIYHDAINRITGLNLSYLEIEDISKLSEEKQKEKITELMEKEAEKYKCDETGIKITNYTKHDNKISVTIKNNNACTWTIKSYSEVRVFFTDNSYEDVYLSTNIDLMANDTYTFNGCYLGYNNSNKVIKNVIFIN